uniref:Uncharacterized protein n=1 Tax=Cucumis melo TaxID=3656 RepID=A0A9I9EL10_CUCME
MAGAFWGTRVLEIVKKHDSGGLVWKRIKLTTTRKANAKKRLHRVWQAQSGACLRRGEALTACKYPMRAPLATPFVTLECALCFENNGKYDLHLFEGLSKGAIVATWDSFPRIIFLQFPLFVWNEAVLKACSEPPPPKSSGDKIGIVFSFITAGHELYPITGTANLATQDSGRAKKEKKRKKRLGDG